MARYDENGYFNFSWLYARPFTVQLCIGGRGTGKTYGALKYCIENKIRFLYLRRTNAVVEILSTKENNPLKRLNYDNEWSYETKVLTKYTTGFYNTEIDENGKIIYNECVGYMAALSTFNNIRGFDGSDIEVILFDEFVPTKNEKKIKGEFEGLLHCYETINRNRDAMEGRAPLRLICFSNADSIANQIFIGFNVVNIIIRMKNKKTYIYEDKERSLGVYLLDDSPVSKAKAETSFYKMLSGSEFFDMSLANEFVSDRTSTPIKQKNLKELIPFAAIGDLCLYEIKGGGIYASTHISGSPEIYTYTATDAKRFKHRYPWILLAYLDKDIICESYMAESLLINLLYNL